MMRCSSCKFTYDNGCCTCTSHIDINYGCAHFVKKLQDFEQKNWKCAKCRPSATPIGAGAASSSVVTLEAVLNEIQGLRSQLTGLPALINDVSAMKEDISSLKRGDTFSNIERKLNDVDKSVSYLKGELQLIKAKCNSMQCEFVVMKSLISTSENSLKQYISADLVKKFSKMDVIPIMLRSAESDNKKVSKSIQTEFGLVFVVLFGMISKMNFNELDIKASSIENGIEHFKRQISSTVKGITKEISDVKAAKEEISRMVDNFSWANLDTVDKKINDIKTEIETFQTYVSACEQELSEKISNLKNTKELSVSEIAELASKSVTQKIIDLNAKADSIQNKIPSIETQFMPIAYKLKTQLSDLQLDDNMINKKIELLNIWGPQSVLDVRKKASSIKSEAGALHSQITTRQETTNELFKIKEGQEYSYSTIPELAEKLSGVTFERMFSLNTKSTGIRNEIGFVDANITKSEKEIKKTISELEVSKEFNNKKIAELQKNLSFKILKTITLGNQMALIKTQISNNEQNLMKSIKDSKTDITSQKIDLQSGTFTIGSNFRSRRITITPRFINNKSQTSSERKETILTAEETSAYESKCRVTTSLAGKKVNQITTAEVTDQPAEEVASQPAEEVMIQSKQKGVTSLSEEINVDQTTETKYTSSPVEEIIVQLNEETDTSLSEEIAIGQTTEKEVTSQPAEKVIGQTTQVNVMNLPEKEAQATVEGTISQPVEEAIVETTEKEVACYSEEKARMRKMEGENTNQLVEASILTKEGDATSDLEEE